MELRRPEWIPSTIARRPARMPISPRTRGRARVRHSRAVRTPPVRSVHPMDPIGSVGRGWLMGGLSLRQLRPFAIAYVCSMSLDQKRARVFGVLFLITFITSIPALGLYQPVLDDPVGYIAGAGHDKQILFAALLELLLIIANIGTAVVIFPIVRRQNEELALGYVTARVIECTFILAGILCVLGIVTLRNQVAGASEGAIAYTLAAIKDWTFLLGPGWVVGWGNGLILGYLMYRSELVPRRAAWL